MALETSSQGQGATAHKLVRLHTYLPGPFIECAIAYPWRWTTPIVFSTFLVLAVLLAAINTFRQLRFLAKSVPLSAYDVDQVFTYRPNDTLPALPLSNILPGILRHSIGDFTPQILNVGDIVRLNNSNFNSQLYNYRGLRRCQPESTRAFVLILQQPVLGWLRCCEWFFSHNRRPGAEMRLETNDGLPGVEDRGERHLNLPCDDVVCDLTSAPQQNLCDLASDLLIWNTVGKGPEAIPYGEYSTSAVFTDWGFNGGCLKASMFRAKLTFQIASSLAQQEAPAAYSAGLPSSFTVTVQPCYNCSNYSADEEAEDSLAPHDDSDDTEIPGRFLTIAVNLQDHQQKTILQTAPNTTDVFTVLLGLIPSYFAQDPPLSALNTAFNNAFQSYYNLLRMELGVILDNQIYASPGMYNLSISDVYVKPGRNLTLTYRAANDSRRANGTVWAEWKETVEGFHNSDRVPVMLYLRPISRLKPWGTAMTSVFVSTFAMLSVLWTVFNVIAGILAESSAGQYPTLDGSSMLIYLHKDALGSARISDPEAGVRGQARYLGQLRASGPSPLPMPVAGTASDVSLDSIAAEDESKAQFSTLERPSEKRVASLAGLEDSLARIHRALVKQGLLQDSNEPGRILSEGNLEKCNCIRLGEERTPTTVLGKWAATAGLGTKHSLKFDTTERGKNRDVLRRTGQSSTNPDAIFGLWLLLISEVIYRHSRESPPELLPRFPDARWEALPHELQATIAKVSGVYDEDLAAQSEGDEQEGASGRLVDESKRKETMPQCGGGDQMTGTSSSSFPRFISSRCA
ncbi:hypothetical protein C8R46DRAFT_1283197 [Mycena filopes]|nr:hypothetical protein C8R46DRAFT_1283197 [Mycena filopes]